ncbi:hypothetical protein JHK85_027332 [Glycine max]|nr:hypothetical protein JHK85_027332 [Glycine max]
MSSLIHLFLFFFFFLCLSHSSLCDTCPLNFTILGRTKPTSFDTSRCQVISQALRLVQSDYLRRSGFFLPPLNASDTCWTHFQSYVNNFDQTYNITTSCGFKTSWISQGCNNVTTKQDFESLVPQSALQNMRNNCNQSLENNSPCALCTTSFSTLPPLGDSVGNLTYCTKYASIYAAAFANRFGPSDPGTAKCLFSLQFSSNNNNNSSSSSKRKKVVIAVVSVVGVLVVLLLVLGVWVYCKLEDKVAGDKDVRVAEIGLVSGLDSMEQSTTLIRFTFDDIKKATKNFSRDNIVGRGGYGNVYKGLLPDGSEVAFKRFKNCSASGDASFTHEVEVIASVRHVNLVALRGYCSVTTRLEGYQRIIVCDMVKNGSLHDHLFGSNERSDVFSFGVVLLELLSGRKALQMNNDGQPSSLTDWAWSLVRTGKALDVIEDGMPQSGSEHVLEKYVLIAVLCSHPQLYARPTMDQVVKMMETDESVPSIPERPIPLVAGRLDIERSVSSSGSGQLSSPTGYRSYTIESDRQSSNSRDERSSSSRILSTD